MKKAVVAGLISALIWGVVPAAAAWEVKSDTKVAGFGHPESVAFDSGTKQLYVSRFGPQLKPLQKDGKGFISRVDLKGTILEEKFLPGSGGVLHKPKGLWVSGSRLWTTDIDVVWVFDLKTKKGRQAALPGAKFANDPVVEGSRLFVSDTQSGTIYLVQPADFLDTKPQVSRFLENPGFGSNGLCISVKGTLLVGAFAPQGSLGSLHEVKDGKASPISQPLGSLDGLAMLPDGTILYTDWRNQGLFAFQLGGKPRRLAGGFKGPADFAVVPRAKGYLVVVPDLVSGDLRFIEIRP
ncbi:MAG: hypothetical protein PVG03_01615 [Desulfarculaceae bacterium]|jgi:hypothetical protein